MSRLQAPASGEPSFRVDHTRNSTDAFHLYDYYLPGLLGSGSGNIFDSLDRYFTRLMGADSFFITAALLRSLIAFVINYACYFSEIFRGGVESISHGQYEAGQVLGMTKGQIFRKVIFKQVVKRILPPMSNEVITLVKDTALANVIAIPEIIKAGKRYGSGRRRWFGRCFIRLSFI